MIKLYNIFFSNSSSRGAQDQTLTPAFVNAHDSSDLRRLKFSPSTYIHPVTQDTLPRMLANPLAFGSPNTGMFTPELYLISAECNARLGNLTPALDRLNTLRKNRIYAEDYKAFVSADKKQVLKWVLDEEWRELAYNARRWCDMRRLAVAPETNYVAKREFNDGIEVTILPTELQYYTFLLPAEALSDKITQNER